MHYKHISFAHLRGRRLQLSCRNSNVYEVMRWKTDFFKKTNKHKNLLGIYCEHADQVRLIKVECDVYYSRIQHGHGMTVRNTNEPFHCLIFISAERCNKKDLEYIEVIADKVYRDRYKKGSRYSLRNTRVVSI